jgi:TRAP-type C4-dicarboxylate transport system permease small subunit
MFKKLDDHFEEALIVLLMAAMTVLIVVQIFMRYVVQESLTWSEELARYIFVWATYLGVAYGVKKNAHICVEAATMYLPERIKAGVYLLAQFVFLLFAALVVKEGFVLSMKIFKFGQSSAALGMPMGVIYLAPTVGFALVFIRLIQNIVAGFRRLRTVGVAA